MKNLSHWRRRAAYLLMLPLLLTGQALASAADPEADDAYSWREQYAYAVGSTAYTYAFPYLYLTNLRWMWTTLPRNPERIPYMPVNQFWHSRHLTDASYRDGGSPNNDTLYSAAWIDLSDEPVIVSVPPTGDRYYAMELASFNSDNFAYIGQRATGNQGGDFAIVHKGWQGELPEGVQRLEQPSPTPWVFLLGRTLVNGQADIPNVIALQDQFKLTPLSLWQKGGSNAVATERHDVWKPAEPKHPLKASNDPLDDWKTINYALTENPPPERDQALMKLFASVNIGPGLNVENQDEDTKRGLIRALEDGRRMLQAASLSRFSHEVNGWSYPSKSIGRAGDKGDFLTRAAYQSLSGIVANDPEEAVYIAAMTDADGNRLTGSQRYQLRFAANNLPEADAFWSLTMYGTDKNLVDNPINRYAIGDRTQDLQYGEDGSLTIHIQQQSPGEELEANWLPAPEGAFHLLLRAYLPGKEILDQTWAPPALSRLK